MRHFSASSFKKLYNVSRVDAHRFDMKGPMRFKLKGNRSRPRIGFRPYLGFAYWFMQNSEHPLAPFARMRQTPKPNVIGTYCVHDNFAQRGRVLLA
jgi:hypothetical protein